MEEELVWIKKIKSGETRYFRNLYDKHSGKLFSLCYRFTNNQADAEEQLQEIFMRLLAKIDQFRGDASFKTWAHRLAVNHLINFTNKKKMDYETPELDTKAAPVGRPELLMALEQAVSALPDGFRNVFILHDREGFAHEEIAKMLGCSPATSRSQLCRARLALRNLLKPAMMEAST